MRPRVLLADEPTGNLDSAAGRQILDLLERMNGEGLTLVVVTHDINVGRRANRVLVLRDGEIVHRVAGADLAPELLLAAGFEAAKATATATAEFDPDDADLIYGTFSFTSEVLLFADLFPDGNINDEFDFVGRRLE